jgi:ABC-type dipeptide/oligopeptide/nickel transport system permease component
VRAYLLRRSLSGAISVWGVVTIVFMILRVVPGDPAAFILGEFATPEAIADLRTRLGLADPLWIQYTRFLGGTVRGDFGTSLVSNQPVLQETLNVFPQTLVLAMAGLAVGIAIGLPAGVIAAQRRNSPLDTLLMGGAAIGASVPSFAVAIILLILFAYKIPIFPVIAVAEATRVEYFLALILPAVTLGLVLAAALARITRSSVLEVLGYDYVRTARAKGLDGRTVVRRHVLRNAAIPIVTLLGLNLGRLLGGTIVVETVFTRLGVGRLLVGAILARDYTQVQGTIVLFATVLVVLNLAVDLFYGLLDPRVRYE